MSISTRFAVAIHVLAAIEEFKDAHTTSAFIAGSVNTNPVVIRRTLRQLALSGLVDIQPGVGGASLTRPAREISLRDVYAAVAGPETRELFAIHPNPNPACPVGGTIQDVLTCTLEPVYSAMEQALGSITLQDVMNGIHLRRERPA